MMLDYITNVKEMLRQKEITIAQTWQAAHDNWKATRDEKRSFKHQFLMIQNPNMDLSNERSNDSYFCQLKNGAWAVHNDAEKFANEFFGINRKFNGT